MKKHYRQDLSYLTFYYKNMKGGILSLLFLLVALQLGLMYVKVSTLPYKETGCALITEYDISFYDYNTTTLMEGAPSFQELVSQCRYPLFFTGGFLLMVILFLWQSFQTRNHAERNYTMQRIGIPHRRRYFLTVVANFLLFVSFYIVENLVLLGSYSIYETCIREEYVIFNGFFQAYACNSFIRGLCPITSPLLFLRIFAVLLFLAILVTTIVSASENQHHDIMILYLSIFGFHLFFLVPDSFLSYEISWTVLLIAVAILALNFTTLHNIEYFKYAPTDTLTRKEEE